MKEARIIFMGTPQFAVETLKKLLDSGKHIVGVVTSPDKPAGRGRKLKQSDVKKYALTQGLPVLQPSNLKDSEFLKQLKNLKADLQIVVAFRMLPKVVWSMPKLGTFNLHASLLPQYRGAAPINWAIINQEKVTGVTTFFIDDKIDTGELILQEKISIDNQETAGSLHDKLMVLGSELVLKTVSLIEQGKVTTKPQPNNSILKSAPKLTPENTKIDWSLPVNKIDAFIRGLSPYPAAWSQLKNGEEEIIVKIYACTIQKEPHTYKTGKIIASKKELKIAAKDGFVVCKEIKLAGKRKMDAQSLLNGFKFDPLSEMN
jgi:methionyl-tRNA formyltransferase